MKHIFLILTAAAIMMKPAGAHGPTIPPDPWDGARVAALTVIAR